MKCHNAYVYSFIRENGGWSNWQMVLINTENCKDSIEALKKEREYIEQLKATLNKNTPSRSSEEKRDYHTEYRAKNKTKLYKQKMDYYYTQKPEVSEYAKQYYLRRKEDILRRKKEKYENNRGFYLQEMKDYRLKKKQQPEETPEQ